VLNTVELGENRVNKIFPIVAIVVASVFATYAQSNAPTLFRQPTISKSDIVFSYAGDLWTVPRTGGDGKRLTSGVGVETSPYFSPDGSLIASETYTRRLQVTVHVGTWQGFLNALKGAASFGDLLGTLFGSWGKTLTALTALIAAAAALWAAIRKLRKPKE